MLSKFMRGNQHFVPSHFEASDLLSFLLWTTHDPITGLVKMSPLISHLYETVSNEERLTFIREKLKWGPSAGIISA